MMSPRSAIPNLGQLRPMFRRRRGRAHFSTVGDHLSCRCRCRFRNSQIRILCRLLSSLSWSRTSTVCVDLDAFHSEGSGLSDGDVSVYPVEKDRVSVSLVNSGDNDQTNMIIEVSRFQPLKRPQSPVNISSDSQLVVESPSYYEVPVVPLIESVVQLSQISALSSVQLSPNLLHDVIHTTL